MHELSIAQHIVEIVQQYVDPVNVKNVAAIRLKVGAVAGVVADSLEFSFHAITADTPLMKARLEIEHVPFRIECSICGVVSENETGIIVCDSCGSPDAKVLSGAELEMTEIEILEAVQVVT
ncbi:MAG: hydrogenase maturation nickel metallochaperone HypA [Bacteroidota bacterium]